MTSPSRRERSQGRVQDDATLPPLEQQTGERRQEIMSVTAPTEIPQSLTGENGGSLHGRPKVILRLPTNWTPEDINRRISENSSRVVIAMNEQGDPVFWDAIKRCQYDCANTLLNYAKTKGIPITFRRENSNLLLWAIENNAYRSIKFILEKLREKCTSFDETCDQFLLMSEHLWIVGDKCPELLVDLLKNDKLTVEYTRFQVPKAVFDNDGKIPVAMTTKKRPISWTQMDGERAKEFWSEHCIHESDQMDSGLDSHVTVIWKVLCIGPMTRRPRKNIMKSSLQLEAMLHQIPGWSHFCIGLYEQGLPVEVFESKTLQNLADWWWFFICRPTYVWAMLCECVATLLYTISTILYGQNENGATPLITAIFFVSFSIHAIGNIYYLSLLKLSITFFPVVLCCLRSFLDNSQSSAAFTVSFIYVLEWIALFRLWQPFDQLGPFIAMVNSAMRDSWRFLLLGWVLIVGYSAAFMVLSKEGFNEGYKESFNSFLRAIETLLYACLGNFDEKMFRSSSDFLTVWVTLLFASFIYMAPIVLISLLVSILTDTYDRVRSKEKAELRKLRLRTMAKLQLGFFFPISLMVNRYLRGVFPRSVDSFFGFLFYGCCRLSQHLTTADVTIMDVFEGSYFHFLVPEDSETKSHVDEWQGRLVAIERTVKSEARKNERSYKEQHAVLEEEMKELRSQSLEHDLKEENWKCRMEGRMERLETAMDKILQELARIGPSSS